MPRETAPTGRARTSMLASLKVLSRLFDRREKLQVLGLAGILVVGSLLEVVGIGLVLPFISLVENPALALDHDRVGPLLEGIGVRTPGQVVTVAGATFLLALVVKNAFLAFQWHVLFRFLYERWMATSCRLLDLYLGAPLVEHLQRNTADLIRNMTSEVGNLYGSVFKPALMVLAEGLVTAGLLVLLLIVEPVASIAALLFLGLSGGAFTYLLKNRLVSLGEVRVEQHGRMIQWVNQGIGGIREIKVLGIRDYFVDRFGLATDEYGDTLRRSALLMTYPRLVLETVAGGVLVGVVIVLVVTQRDLGAILATLALFGAATLRLLPSINRVVMAVNQIRYNLPSLELIGADLGILSGGVPRSAPSRRAEPLRFEREISLTDLTFAYPGAPRPAVEGITLTIPKGHAVALVGPSGSGKTTLVSLILGLLAPSRGRIALDGVDVEEQTRGWHAQLGYIPQDIFLLDDSIRRNVAFGVSDDEVDDDAVWRALELAQLDSFVRGLERQLDTTVGERGGRMSGGQRQRIGIARALYHDPEILVLDEPTASLDAETEHQVTEAIEALAGRKTLIVVSHRLRAVRRCDRIYILEGGEVVDSGDYEDLMTRNARFRHMALAPELGIA